MTPTPSARNSPRQMARRSFRPREQPPHTDPARPRKYRWRNLVERLFSKLKNWRRVATRYDKTAESYLGFVALASVTLWLPFVHVA
jgi:transposase